MKTYQVNDIYHEFVDPGGRMEPPFYEYGTFDEAVNAARQKSEQNPHDYGVWENQRLLLAILKDGVWFGRLEGGG